MVGRSLVFIFVLLSATVFVGVAQESTTTLGQDDGAVLLSWDADPATYRVEVRRDGQVFIDTETDQSELRLDLAPGIYEYRISVVNPFGGVVSVSSWQKLELQRARIPYFRVKDPAVAWEGETEVILEVDASALKPDTRFQLVKGDESAEPVSRSEGDLIRILADTSSLSPGSWDLVAISPSGKRFRHPEALVLRPKRAPNYSSVGEPELPNSGLYPLEISGESFDKEMEIHVEGRNGDIPVAAVDIIDENTALVYLNLGESEPGDYTLVLANPAGEETRIEKAVTVLEPELDEKPKEQPRLEFQIGWAPMATFVPFYNMGVYQGTEVIPTFIGIDTSVGFHSGWQQPFFRGLGVEVRGMIGLAGPNDNFGALLGGIGTVDIVGYWRPLVSGRVAPVIQFGVGNMWMEFAQNAGLENLLYLRTSFALDFVDIREMFRIGVSSIIVLGSDEVFPTVGIIFRRGFRM